MDPKWRPSLKQFLNRQLSIGKKNQLYYEVCGIKYSENKNTNFLSRIILFVVVFCFFKPFDNMISRIGMNGLVKIIFLISYVLIMVFLLEMIHWTYAKYEKHEE